MNTFTSTFSILYHRPIIVSDISLKHAFGYIPVAAGLDISLTTFTQCAPEATEFGEITQNKTTPFKVIQGRRFWYQSKAHFIRLPISARAYY